MTPLELKDKIFSTETFNYRASVYLNINDFTLRISNHLPKIHNIVNNENTKIFFLFTDIEISENKVEKYMEENMPKDIEWDYAIFESEEDISYVKMKINNF
jgi:hypothetical protein